ncbi:glutathione binding-like protein [Caballeronia sp. LjRoot29]|uniref:glutathione binding-like protein n=1 Tax=Caballeronia sp. LjRoot29 TaxID=3342315 RepID=UPI003F50D08F
MPSHDYFVGDELTGVYIQLLFVAQTCLKFRGRDAFPKITAFVNRIEARPAYHARWKRAARKRLNGA